MRAAAGLVEQRWSCSGPVSVGAVLAQLGVTDLAPIVHVLVQHSESNDKFSRLTALNWLHTFVTHGREHLMPFCAQVLNAILASLSHPEDEIREAARRAARAAAAVAGRAVRDAHAAAHAAQPPRL